MSPQGKGSNVKYCAEGKVANRGFLTEGEVMGAEAQPEGSGLAVHDDDKLSSSSSDAAQLEDVEDEGT